MMTVPESISSLLYVNDVVVVPGLGAFVRTIGSASVNVITHQFEQPFATVSFDQSLREENDLLSSYLSSINQVSLEDARRSVLVFVNDCFTNLKAGRSISLPELGVLSYDVRGEIVFVQDKMVNYNPDAFGLSNYEVSPVFQSKTKEEIRSEIAQQQKDKNTPMTVDRKSVHQGEERPKRHLGWLWILLVLGALAGGLFSLVYFGVVKINYRDWFQKEGPVAVVDTVAKEKSVVLIVDTIVSDTSISKTDSVKEAESRTIEEIVKAHAASQKDDQQESNREIKDRKKESVKEASVCIIAGCYSSQGNAEHHMRTLKENGFGSAFVKQRGKVWDVCYGSYMTVAEAKSALDEIRKSDSKAWILK